MKSRKLLNFLIVFYSVVSIFTGCGAGGVKTVDKTKNVEILDPFKFGDEFTVNGISSGPSDGVIKEGRLGTDDNSSAKDNQYSGNKQNENNSSSDNSDNIERETASTFIGYRIQIEIFDIENKSSAYKMAEKARKELNMNVYIEFVTPFYRVRVGDFTERADAEKAVKILQDKSYKDALLVRTRINTR